MSIEDNKAVVLRLYDEAVNGQNLGVLDEIVAPDLAGHTPFLERSPGLEGFKLVYGEVHAAFPDYRITVEDQIAEGDKVVTRYTALGTHRGEFMGVPATGEQVTMSGIDVDRLAGGRIVEHWSEADVLGVMEQLGAVSTSE